MDAQTIYGLGIALVFAGIFIVLIAILLLLFYSGVKGKGGFKGGGALLIGPFPIIFGTDRESIKIILILSIILTALIITTMIIFYLISR
ncbi:MAG: TIGR00304 family membrane protein [Candidatus Bathycorpusculaceae bacterium]